MGGRYERPGGQSREAWRKGHNYRYQKRVLDFKLEGSGNVSPIRSDNLLERLTADGPKRILSLDGGGIRGALELGLP
jgi:hypothetical protein